MSFDNEGWTSPTTLQRLHDVMPPGIGVDTSLNRFIGQWFTRCDGELYNLNHHVKFDENLNVKNKKQMSLKTTDNISDAGTRMRKLLASSLNSIDRDVSKKRQENAELSYEKNSTSWRNNGFRRNERKTSWRSRILVETEEGRHR